MFASSPSFWRSFDDQAAVQDLAGNDAASFTDVVIENDSRVLPAPTNLRAAGLDDTRIGLAWNAPDVSGLVWPEHLPGSGIYGYKIEASADGGTTWTTVASTSNRNTDYIHTGLTHGAVRHYRVSAINITFAGLPSNVAGTIALGYPAARVDGRIDERRGHPGHGRVQQHTHQRDTRGRERGCPHRDRGRRAEDGEPSGNRIAIRRTVGLRFGDYNQS